MGSWTDSFTRTVARGLGGSWSWSNDDSGSSDSATENVYVDGSVAILPWNREAGGGYNYESFRGFPNVDAGVVQFDFWVPSLAGQGSYGPSYGVNFQRSAPVEMYVMAHDTVGGWLIGAYWHRSASVPMVPFYPDVSTWYTAQMVFDIDQNVEYRVWKQGDAEPVSPIASGRINDTGSSTDRAFFDFYYGAINEDAKLDNFSLLWSGVISAHMTGAFSAAAVKSASRGGAFSAAAWFIYPFFRADAWIVGSRTGHSRFYDHYGTQTDTVVVIDGPIDKFPSGTNVHVVLADIFARLVALESGWHRTFLFSAGAWIQPNFRADAVIYGLGSLNVKTVPMEAEIVGGKTEQPITADAWIIRVVAPSFGADAYFIDLVC